MTKERNAVLPYGRLAGYGVMTAPLALAGLPVIIFLPPFYAQDMGLDIALLGLVLMLTRIFDMVSDPIVGSISDNFQTPMGRRRPWIIVGVLLMMLATWKVFMPTGTPGHWQLAGWLVVFYMGWTMIAVPYQAWGIELTDDYHERTRVAGSRELFSVLGMVIVFVVASMATEHLPAGASETPAIIESIGLMTIVLLPMCCGLLFLIVPERKVSVKNDRRFFETLSDLKSNRPFMLLICAAFITELGVSINNSILVIFYDNVVGLPDRVDDLVVLFFGSALLGIPLWLWLAGILGKHRAVCLAAVWNAVSLLYLVTLEQGDFDNYAIIEVSRGLAFAGPLVLGASMIADVVDYDTWRHGQSRAGFIAAFWITAAKLASAIGIGIALPAIDWIGFSAGAENSPEVLYGVSVVYAIIPAILGLLAIPLVWNFPLTARKSVVVRNALARQNRREELMLTLPY